MKTMKELQTLEKELNERRVQLLEEMNNLLYIRPDAAISVDYKRMSKEYSSVTDQLKQVQDDLKNKKYQVGRPPIGVGKPVKITLPEEDWKEIEERIASGQASNYADYFRQLHQSQLETAGSSKWKSFSE